MRFKHSIVISAEERNGKVTVFLRVGVHSQRKKISTGYVVTSYEWDKVSKKVCNRIDADDINNSIASLLNSMKKVFSKYELIEEREPTIDEVVNDFFAMTGRALPKKDARKDAIKYFSEYIDTFKDIQSTACNWAESTEKKFTEMKHHWERFEKRKKKHYAFDVVDDSLLFEYCNHMTSLGYKNTTLQKEASFLRWYLRWAFRSGYYNGESHETFRPKFKGGSGEYKEIVYLEKDELQRLKDLTFAINERHLEQVRDVFLFACFCGLRYIDVAMLLRSQIYDDYMEVTTIKTDDRLYINLNDMTRGILDKYKDLRNRKGTALPVVSNQKTNEYLKDVCKMAEIDQPVQVVYFVGSKRYEETYKKYEIISFHAARRTFITQALRLGMPSEVIMKFSGHHSTEMLKPYMKVVDELKAKEMQKFNDMFTDKKVVAETCDQIATKNDDA